jgi:hypothetical protein
MRLGRVGIRLGRITARGTPGFGKEDGRRRGRSGGERLTGRRNEWVAKLESAG